MDGARKAAFGSIVELVDGYPTFVMVTESWGGQDPKLWHGMKRLADFASLDRTKKGYEVAQRLLAAFRINPPPPHLMHLTLELEEFSRVWEKTNR